MKFSNDAAKFADLANEARQLQQEYEANKPNYGDHPQPDEVNDFRSGRMRYDELPDYARFWVMDNDIERPRRENPYEFSELSTHLQLETWKPKEALLLLVGIDNAGAMVEWSTENIAGAIIDKPVIRRANWLTGDNDYYIYPLAYEFAQSTHEAKEELASAERNGDTLKAKALKNELAEMEFIDGDPTTKYIQKMLEIRSEMLGIISRRWHSGAHDTEVRQSPEFFVRWAEVRGFEIEWAQWARDNDLLDCEPPITEPPFFDADAEDYPKLLHIAARAWGEARKGTRGTAKQRISAFLEKSYPELSASEREAIAFVGNWQKTGGRPKTGG